LRLAPRRFNLLMLALHLFDQLMFLHGKIAVFMGARVERFAEAIGFVLHDLLS
jgi:hypothetical protein